MCFEVSCPGDMGVCVRLVFDGGTPLCGVACFEVLGPPLMVP
jgi:hypothetical protein